MSAYLAPERPAQAEIRDRGSRFLAIVAPAAGENEAREGRDEVAARYPGATHCCWAWRLGEPPRERSSDAGEPAGTAGMPILQTLRGAGLSDVVAVVVRWFGGVKLGKGGLARAYAAATRAALSGLATVRKVPTVLLALEVPYERVGGVKRLVRPPEVELLTEEYGERARLVLSVHRELRAGLEEALADLGVFVPEPVAPVPGESRT
jgi:uncharacterized YigZ family protein